MKITLVGFLTILLLHTSLAEPEPSSQEVALESLKCPEIKEYKDMGVVGQFMHWFSTTQNSTNAKFLLALEDDKDVEIGHNNWEPIKNGSFDPSRKTYFIIHGYRSKPAKPWIQQLKKVLLKTHRVNLIIVDWSADSYKVNYIDAVQSTYFVAKEIVRFLRELKHQIKNFIKTPKIKYNHLYFIGHSLGAHISGQTGYKLRKQPNFYKVERITGLDPAQPCFTKINSTLKIDKSDADFVDIIHTNTGSGDGSSGMGLKEPVGHVDFYVNGGVVQPQCKDNYFFDGINKMICSHKLASAYFIESIINSHTEGCKFTGHEWDTTHSDALRILKETKQVKCQTCPEMGINAVNYGKPGTYLVITSSKEPKCGVDNEDINQLEKVLELLNPKPQETTTESDMLENIHKWSSIFE